MGRLIVEHRQEGDIHQALVEFYGEVIPVTAWLLEQHLVACRIPLRMPDGQVRVANLEQAAAEFGGDLTESRRYLHHLHAIGTLAVEADGTVDLPPRG